MSTETEIRVDSLNELLLGDEALDGEACDTRKDFEGKDCSREAVFCVRWQADGRVQVEDRCGCARVTVQCLHHGELYMALMTNDDLVACSRCQRFMVPYHIDKIRRTR